MNLAETILYVLLASQPFGNVPFTVTAHGGDQVKIEVLSTQPVTIILDNQMEVVEMINHIQDVCNQDDEV